MDVFRTESAGSTVAGSRNNVVPISPRPVRLLRRVVPPARQRIERRRANRQQGLALEKLGHAVEYLADSRLFLSEEEGSSTRCNQEAMQILMKASRTVFAECREVVPLWLRLGRAVDKICTVERENLHHGG